MPITCHNHVQNGRRYVRRHVGNKSTSCALPLSTVIGNYKIPHKIHTLFNGVLFCFDLSSYHKITNNDMLLMR